MTDERIDELLAGDTEMELDEPSEELFYMKDGYSPFGDATMLYTTKDNFYSSQNTAAGQVRFRKHPNGEWETKIRVPTYKPSDAHDVFSDIIERLSSRYDLHFGFTEDSFSDSEEYAVESRGVTLKYNRTDQIDIEETVLDEMTALGVGGTYIGAGAAVGSVVPGVGTLVGAGAGCALFVTDAVVADQFDTNTTPSHMVASAINRKRKEDFRGEIPDNRGFYRNVNQGDEEAREQLGDLLSRQFINFSDLQGVTVEAGFDDYRDAVSFVGTVLQDEPRDVETAPSIYTEPTAFKELFEELDESDQEIMVDNVYSNAETDDDIEEWIEENYADLIDDELTW